MRCYPWAFLVLLPLLTWWAVDLVIWYDTVRGQCDISAPGECVYRSYSEEWVDRYENVTLRAHHVLYGSRRYRCDVFGWEQGFAAEADCLEQLLPVNSSVSCNDVSYYTAWTWCKRKVTPVLPPGAVAIIMTAAVTWTFALVSELVTCDRRNRRAARETMFRDDDPVIPYSQLP